MTGLAEIADLLGVADPEGDSAVSARQLRNHLSGSREPGLLIFDNAGDPEQIRPLLPVAGRTMVLITSTDRAFNQLSKTIDLVGFTRPEATHYLQESTDLADQQGAYTLAELLGDLPLALSTAAATITGRHLTYAHYQQLLNARSLPEVLNRKAGQDYPRSVDQAILLSIDTIETPTGEPQLDATVAWLLGVMAMLSPAGVRRDVLPDRAERLDQALERCERGSLLSWSTTGDTIAMHRLTARVLRERAQSAGTTNELIANALDVIDTRSFEPDQAWARREEGAQLVDHIAAIWDTGLIELTDPALTQRALQARGWAVCQLVESADITRSLSVGRGALTDFERILGPDHPDTLSSRNNLAFAYRWAGRLEEAITLFEATHVDRERLLGPDHLDTLSSRSNLAFAYESAGRLEEAITLFEATLTDRHRILGPDHADTLSSQLNLASTYQSAGRLDEAITLFEATLTDSERLLGLDHLDTLRSRNDLANAYESAGRFDEAITLHQANLSDYKRLFGPDNPHTLSSCNNLAFAYESAGRLEEAIALFEATLSDYKRFLGPDNPDTLTSQHNLASTYQSAGRLDEAITLFEATLTDRQRLVGPDHPDTLSTGNNLAGAYRSVGRIDEAITLYRTTISDSERILGPDHPHTLSSRNNLASLYNSVGRTDEAITLFEATLADRERLLGPSHPHTLTSRNNLAGAYGSAGRIDEGITLFEATHSDCERILGPDHPITRAIQENLASIRADRNVEE
ncbi:tetratricopeptide repeat protein [Nocardia sp. NBC_01327]|uniref:tetratricopeptide repeat protein n=1 Tax=Nocardia sp. NBC_01327 TaxID=2903593 RepID=UPI002E111F5B|nr:tetratricopeptide repeat protein [Nocardia sp. NBC_01327]